MCVLMLASATKPLASLYLRVHETPPYAQLKAVKLVEFSGLAFCLPLLVAKSPFPKTEDGCLA